MKPLILLGWLFAFGGDAASSALAIHQGAQERLLPVRSPAAVATVVGTQALTGWLLYTLIKPTHPKMAKLFYTVTVSSHAVAAIWNAAQVAR